MIGQVLFKALKKDRSPLQKAVNKDMSGPFESRFCCLTGSLNKTSGLDYSGFGSSLLNCVSFVAQPTDLHELGTHSRIFEEISLQTNRLLL